MPKQLTHTDQLFYALGDPTRMAVVRQLCLAPKSVSELAAPFKMALPSFVQHLKVLEDSGWISSSKSGRVRTCELKPEALERSAQWLQEQASWAKRLNQLDSYVLKLKSEESPS